MNKFNAIINLNGERKSPIFDNYYGNIIFPSLINDQYYSYKLNLKTTSIIIPNQKNIECTIELIMNISELEIGTEFFLTEGRRIIGSGIIK